MPSPQRSLGHSLFKQKFSQKFLCFFFFFFFFIKISKFALPGVMLMYERTIKDRKKERKKAERASEYQKIEVSLEVSKNGRGLNSLKVSPMLGVEQSWGN